MREKRDIAGKVEEIFFSRNVLPVNIDHIADQAKYIIGNANGNEKIGQGIR
ncbi:MAG: hypothetical protein HQK96_19165 [Nitrospirae bacterium]|nr:hypothetical protein [Nitrospirota bacterium]